MKFKPKTREGFDYRIYATDGGGEYPIHGAIKKEPGLWLPIQWTNRGRFDSSVPNKHDLIPDLPEPFEFDCTVDVGSQNYRAPKECARFWGHKVRVRIEVVE
jgi:hypothetical protein